MNQAIEDLVVVGAGGASRDVVWAVEGINAIQPRWNLLGLLDDDPAKRGAVIHGYPVLGPLSAAAEYPASRLIVGIASYRNRRARREVVERLGCNPERFATIIAASASVSSHAHIGRGTAVLHHSIVASDARLGDHVLVTHSCIIGHNAVLQDYVTVASGVKVSGSVRIGTGAYLGAGSVIRDGKAIGREALVGIGSVVLRDVPEGTTVLGNPAADIDRCFNRLRGFFQRSLTDNFRAGLEESSPEFDAADSIHSSRGNVTRGRLFLLTDGLTSTREYADAVVDGVNFTHHVWDIERIFRMESSGSARETIDVRFEKFGDLISTLASEYQG